MRLPSCSTPLMLHNPHFPQRPEKEDSDIMSTPQAPAEALFSDEEIIALYFARDEQAIRRTDERYGQFCHRLAMSILSNRLDAEECVSDTYIKTWNSIPPTRPRSLQAFLGRLVKNISINRYHESKAQKRNRDFDLSLSELEECIAAPDERAEELPALLDEFLEGLEPLERKLFCGRYWHSYSMDTLARAYGLTVNAVTLRVSRTRGKLKAFLEERGYTV